ncbi:MAG: hypothetical protein JNL39_00795, partial [Opitutaceae bacterium]|nr:hypothetical protein [Opitutaceae bacterium]
MRRFTFGPGARLVLASVLLAGGFSSAADFHVAPHGRDTDPGTAERPFATLTRARDAIRAAKAAGPARDFSVVIRGGTYRLAETLVFSLADSAAPGRTITYAAQPGETPVFTAAAPIPDAAWTKDPAGPAWTAPLPAGMRPFLTLADRAGRLPRARGPAFSPTRDFRTVEGLDKSTLAFPPGALRDWPRLADAEVVVRPNFGWILNILPLESVDVAAGVARTRIPASYPMIKIRWGLRDVNTRGTAWIENVRDHLDEPGEWVLDTAARTVSLIPRDGTRPTGI